MSTGSLDISGRLAVVGGGRMGEAIVTGLLEAGALAAEAIVIAEPDQARCTSLRSALDVVCTSDNREAVASADVVLLAVKPQLIDGVVPGIAEEAGDALVVSIAAGISCARLESLLPEGTAVVRVMPNTPAMVGEGMSVISAGAHASDAQVELVRALFSHIGEAIVLDERHQDAATAISGSGPAYVALFIDALARAGAAHGLERDVAQALATQTARGTAALLDRGGMRPQELVDAVSSPGGTTVAAISALEAAGFDSALSDAVCAAVTRAKELGS